MRVNTNSKQNLWNDTKAILEHTPHHVGVWSAIQTWFRTDSERYHIDIANTIYISQLDESEINNAHFQQAGATRTYLSPLLNLFRRTDHFKRTFPLSTPHLKPPVYNSGEKPRTLCTTIAQTINKLKEAFITYTLSIAQTTLEDVYIKLSPKKWNYALKLKENTLNAPCEYNRY